jgi:hypothetical protein
MEGVDVEVEGKSRTQSHSNLRDSSIIAESATVM